MRAAAATGEICGRGCGEMVVRTRDGRLCGCTGLSNPGPRARAEQNALAPCGSSRPEYATVRQAREEA